MKKLYSIIEKSNTSSKLNEIYNVLMMIVIILSLVPLAFKNENIILILIDRITVTVFIIDYILRWITASIKFNTKKAFIYYPITPFAIIDILSILPSLNFISSSFKLFRLFRLFRAFRVIKAFKLLRYSSNFIVIMNVLKKEKEALLAVGTLAIGYILVSALAVYNIEPDTFRNFFEAVYWATVSLTTVGYGDIYPVTDAGRMITMISSFIGIAIVALPAGIITAGFMSELSKNK